MSGHKPPAAHTEVLAVEVRYGQIYLLDEAPSEIDDAADPLVIIQTASGVVRFIAGAEWGTVDLRVDIGNQALDPDLEGHEDIVEISFETPTGRLSLGGWSWDEEELHALPMLPAGPGTYRLRYHVTGMDGDGHPDVAVDHCLQIWPEPPGDPVVLKCTSSYFRHRLAPEAAPATGGSDRNDASRETAVD
ncbi:hypothetical protein [Streptosporangium sp. CA-115845]|uniref:hypothetical protein n=1 Tax=Streptosporangium sp. CA-115845 TaxID=3240071 RepID=UPI003D945FDB